MEVETTLPEPATQPGPESSPPGPTDGLAGQVLAEQRQESPPGGAPGVSASGKRLGRPPVHGLYSKAAGSDGKHPAILPGAGAVSAPEMAPPGETRVAIPPDLLSKVVGETLSLGENFAAWKLTEISRKAGLSSGEIYPQLQRTQIGDARKQLVADLTPLALQEWGIDPKISPSAAIGLVLGPWLFASVSAYFTLAGLAAERLALDKARGKPTVETPGESPGNG